MNLQATITRARGFTLIELILGIGIMAIVLVAINAVFFSSLRLRDRTTASVDEALPIQQTLTILRRDLQGAVAPTETAILSGPFRVGSVTSLGSAQPAEIEFYTTTGVMRDSEPWGEVQKIAYTLRPSGNRQMPGQDLFRNVTRNLLATITPAPEEQFMLGGVEAIEVSCFDGTQWRNYWDTAVTDTNLPLAVRVRITMAAEHRGAARPYELVVPIASQARTNAVISTLAGS